CGTCFRMQPPLTSAQWRPVMSLSSAVQFARRRVKQRWRMQVELLARALDRMIGGIPANGPIRLQPMPALNSIELASFLREPGVVMRIAVVRSDGSPLVTPIWFLSENNAIYFTPRQRSEWFDCLRRDPRVALCIDEQA